jgi:hypothetical protein
MTKPLAKRPFLHVRNIALGLTRGSAEGAEWSFSWGGVLLYPAES